LRPPHARNARQATVRSSAEHPRPGGDVAAGLAAASKAAAHAGGAAAASAAGAQREGTSGPAGQLRMVDKYDLGPRRATLTLRYTQRHKLLNLGLLQPAVADGAFAHAKPEGKQQAQAQGAAPAVKREAEGGGGGAAAAAAGGAGGGACDGGAAPRKRARAPAPASPIYVDLL
jgi:hypothetical protein